MKSYVIPSLTQGQLKLLQDAGVNFYLFDSVQGSHIVDGAHITNALELLQCTATEAPTDFTDVVQLTLTSYAVPEPSIVRAEGTNVAVDLNGNDMPTPEIIALIESVLSPVIGARPIVLHLPPRAERTKRVRPLQQDGAFHLHIGSSPSGNRRLTPPNYLWGQVVEHRDKCYGQTGRGIPLMDQDAEFAVGEIFENNLYVHIDLLKSYRENCYQLLEMILNKAAPDLNLDAAARRQRMKERHSEGRLKSRQAYIKACGDRVRELVGSYKDALRKKKAQFIAKQAAALSLLRLDSFGGRMVSEDERREQFAAEFEGLKSVSRVQSVTVGPGQVMLKTSVLYAQHPETGQMHEIGQFLIVIQLDGGKIPVRWFNATRRVDGVRPGMNSPTVYSDGSPVLDEILETFVELVARLELSVVAELAIQFIETVNKDLPGATLVNWPLARE